MKVVERSFLHYFHTAISNHLSEKKKNMSCFICSLNTGLTVLKCQVNIFLWLNIALMTVFQLSTQYTTECLFDFLLNIHGKQLRSCQEGQLSYPHFSWAGLADVVN